MKLKISKLGLSLAASAFLLAATPSAFAADLGYLGSASGGAVKDPYGQCLRSADGDQIPDCLPKVAQAQPKEQVMMVSLSADANFDFDKYNLKPAGKADLSKLAQQLHGVKVKSVDIVGHTDSIGTEAYNQVLSEKRAQSAANYLVSEGVSPSVITTRGMGERQPIATNKTAAGRAQNRRVDITVDADKM